MFIGITSADSADTDTINIKPNSAPSGMYAITYGSKKMYSEIIKSGISNPTNIAAAKAMYL